MASHDKYPEPRPLTVLGLKNDFENLGNNLLRLASRVIELRSLDGSSITMDYHYPNMVISLILVNNKVTEIRVDGELYTTIPDTESLKTNLLLCYQHLTKIFFIGDKVANE